MHQLEVGEADRDEPLQRQADGQEDRAWTLHCTVLYCTVLYCTVLYCFVLQQQGHLPLRLVWARGRRKVIRWQKARLVARRGTSTGTEKMNTALRMYSVYSMYIMYSTYLSMYTRSHTARNTSSLHTSW